MRSILLLTLLPVCMVAAPALEIVKPVIAQSDGGDALPAGFKHGSCVVKVLCAERTFWEKATILHAEFHRPVDKPMPERFSRHYCDFYELIRKGVGKSAEGMPELLARVAQHKNLFFKTSWARYSEAVKGTLRIAPTEHRVAALRGDYGKIHRQQSAAPRND